MKKIFDFSNTYINLPNIFFQKIHPKKLNNPKLLELNTKLAETFGLKLNKDDKLLSEVFSGNVLPEGSEPLAMVYAGHQFGNFVSELGDGRAILLGEIFNKKREKFDLQLKGSGVTKFSRNGDGRAPLGPVIREYLVSEAIHYLGIPTTRSLAVTQSDDLIQREKSFPCGVLTRIASSHIRIGTFEYFSYRKDIDSLKKLADYTINRHFSNLNESKDKYQKLLEKVQILNANLVAKWMGVGFIHGVMNTDNISICGETIDYGPCAFMDNYNPNQVFSYIDYEGRYSYKNQGKIMFWNISKFAESLLPILETNQESAKKKALEVLKDFPKTFEICWLKVMKKKLGLTIDLKNDYEIVSDFLDLIYSENLDYTNSFRKLSSFNLHKINLQNLSIKNKVKFEKWLNLWKVRLLKEKKNIKEIFCDINRVNPVYIPRNHLVEKVINEVIQNNKTELLTTALNLIRNPFKFDNKYKLLSVPPKPSEQVKNTFCGT